MNIRQILNARARETGSIYSFKRERLRQAILRTFERRGTDSGNYVLLRDAKFIDSRQQEWATYIAKLKSATFMRKPKVPLPGKDFSIVMEEILEWLEPVMTSAEHATWKPGKGWL